MVGSRQRKTFCGNVQLKECLGEHGISSPLMVHRASDTSVTTVRQLRDNMALAAVTPMLFTEKDNPHTRSVVMCKISSFKYR
jgi:hypothetical protein